MAKFSDELEKQLGLTRDDENVRSRLAVGQRYGDLGEYLETKWSKTDKVWKYTFSKEMVRQEPLTAEQVLEKLE